MLSQGVILRGHWGGLPGQRPEARLHEGFPAPDLNLASGAEIALLGKKPELSVPSGSRRLEFQWEDR